MLCEYRI